MGSKPLFFPVFSRNQGKPGSAITDLARAEPELTSRRARGGARARSRVRHAGRARSAPADRSRPDSTARLAAELCDEVGLSVADLNGVAEKIAGALSAHNDAVKRLCIGLGNALSLGNRTRALGVKTRHSTRRRNPLSVCLIEDAGAGV
jgi:hypothetical protein